MHLWLSILCTPKWLSPWFLSLFSGLHKGDPISLSPFIIVVDYFSCLLMQQFQTCPIMGYRHGDQTLISHLSFADDMIIFTNGHKQSIARLLDCLVHYEGVSSRWIEIKMVLFCLTRLLLARTRDCNTWLVFDTSSSPLPILGSCFIRRLNWFFDMMNSLRRSGTGISG